MWIWCKVVLSLSRGDIASERGENWVTKYCKLLESHNLEKDDKEKLKKKSKKQNFICNNQ